MSVLVLFRHSTVTRDVPGFGTNQTLPRRREALADYLGGQRRKNRRHSSFVIIVIVIIVQFASQPTAAYYFVLFVVVVVVCVCNGCLCRCFVLFQPPVRLPPPNTLVGWFVCMGGRDIEKTKNNRVGCFWGKLV